MASEAFIAQLRQTYLEPVFRFDHDGIDETIYLQSIGEIKRDWNLMPGYCTVTVDNGDGHWDDYLKLHDNLTKKASITFGLSGFVSYLNNAFSFHNNSPNPDTIEDSDEGFIINNFKKGMVISITDSEDNDKTVTVDSMTAGVLTLIATDELTDEDDNNFITLQTEEIVLFTGYVNSADYDYDTKSMTLTLRDRLSLAFENRVQNIVSTTMTASTIAFYENSTTDITLNTISFINGGAGYDFIEDSSNFLISSGLTAGHVINITNSDHNNGNHTVLYVDYDAGRIYLTSSGSLTNESEGAVITATVSGLPAPFVKTGTIIDSANGFLTAGLHAGMLVTISGSVSNDKSIIFQNITAGTAILLSSCSLIDEGEGASVTIKTNSDAWINYFDSLGVTRINGATVSDLVWHILTYYAKLSYLVSTSNPDIDYDSWIAWKADVDDGGYDIYDIGMVSDGDPVSDVLMKIMQLTESVFWDGGEGRIKFMTGRTAGSWRTYEEEILKVDWQVSMEDRINSIYCNYMYMPTNDSWLSDLNGVAFDDLAVGPSVPPYTYTVDVINDRTVFHNTTESAALYIAKRLIRTAAPPRYFTIKTQLLGFSQDVRDDIVLKNLYQDGGFNYDDIGIQINEITFIPEQLETVIKGQYIWTDAELGL